MTADRFRDAYAGRPPWDIGREQPAFRRLFEAGLVREPVLDAGCGTGENALFFAARGLTTVGVDAVEAAIGAARRKASSRGLAAEFFVHDALALEGLGRKFGTVIDSGLFHTFDDDERARYVTSVAAATEPGSRVYVLCFSERETRAGGPRRVTQAELRASFDVAPFRVVGISADEMATRFADGGRKAWLAAVERVPDG